MAPAGKRFAPASSNAATAYSRASNPYENPKRRGNARHTILFAVLGVIVALVVLLGVYAALLGSSALNVVDQAKSLVPTVERMVSGVKSGDTGTLQSDVQELQAGVEAIQDETSDIVWDIAELIPVYGQDVAGARTLLVAAGEAVSNVLVPAASTLESHPISALIQDGNINGTAVKQLCDTLASVTPAIKDVLTTVSSVGTFHISQINDALDQVRGPLNTANQLLDENGDAIRLLPDILGCNGARNYLVIAQNNAEIRATGGLPGALMPVTVDNGSFSFGEMASLSDIIDIAQSPFVLTDDETLLFGESLATVPANMTYTPDFSRASQLLMQTWTILNGIEFDGVIAVDPVFFQHVLALTGQGVTLSDGSVIDGTNAAQALISDTYWNYGENEELMDEHFAEAALAGFDAIRSSAGSMDLSSLLDTVLQGIDEGRFLAYSIVPGEEALFERLGCSGTLASDPSSPVLGVYLNDSTWSKIDWYLDFGTNITGSSQNADGSTSYQVTTWLSNTITPEEAASAPEYITGLNPEKLDVSDMLTTLYLYAPAGGSITNVSVDSSNASLDPIFSDAMHDGLPVVFGLAHLLSGESVSVSYTVTTSPQADKDLVIRSTPTTRG